MKIVSLFAGCGGLDKGFESAGFDVIWANEFDESIHATYRLNHPNTISNTSDIRSLSGKDIPDCDGIIGGPPCQAWSEGGKQLGLADPRGQLFLDYIRIVKEKQPKFFLIENVQGILEPKHKDSLNGFLSILSDAGYHISYELLNSADYKVPQDRFRVFFVGIRKDLDNKFIFPDAVSKTRITLRQAIGDIIEEPCYYGEKDLTNKNVVRTNHDVYIGPYDAKYMARNRVRNWDETSFTIQAQARNTPQHPQAPKMTFISAHERRFAKGYEHLYRRLSVRECARIQTFPDDFTFVYSNVTDGYKMVGNAVPPRMAWFLAIQIRNAFYNSMLPHYEEQIISRQENKPINILSILQTNPTGIIEDKLNNITTDDTAIDFKKHVLVCLVKADNAEKYVNHSAKIYYTGKEVPSSIKLNELFYFMPYMKGKGIRDLYLIKKVRIGSKKEVHPKCSDNDYRVIFEIEYIKNLFEDYIPIHLNIWHTFTDILLADLIQINDTEH